MARNHKFFFDKDGSPKARGPSSESVLMTFLEVDVQGSDHVCRDLMDDLTAIEDESDDSREYIGNAHRVTITPDGVIIAPNLPDSADQDADQDADPGQAPDTPPVEAPVASHSPNQSSSQSPGQSPESADYHVALKHFREVLEDWEAFILDDQLDDPMADEEYL